MLSFLHLKKVTALSKKEQQSSAKRCRCDYMSLIKSEYSSIRLKKEEQLSEYQKL